MTTHTKGPWSVHKSRTTDDVGIMGDNGCLAECFSEIREAGEKAYSEQMANAHLIAAAPDMLEASAPFAAIAVDRAVDAPEWRDTDTVSVIVTIGDLRAIAAAFNKAKGGAA